VDNIQVTHLEKIERMLDDNSDTQDKVVTALQSIDKGIAVISSHKNI
jgi:hypothetical protein